MKISVVVPAYREHFCKLVQLLSSLERQTRRPDIVVVSCSSMRDEDLWMTRLNPFSFQLKLLLFKEHKTAGQNRNIGSDEATSMGADIISFFDADDVMHPQRLEAIEYAFQQGADIVMHRYNRFENMPDISPTFTMYDTFELIANRLVRAPSRCAVLSPNWQVQLHQSQASVKKDIIQKVRFRENNIAGTDSMFCADVVSLPNIQSQCIMNALSHYYPSKTCGIHEIHT